VDWPKVSHESNYQPQFERAFAPGVENADNADEREVHTHEVPEDDIPDEYFDKEYRKSGTLTRPSGRLLVSALPAGASRLSITSKPDQRK
jgi:hypothetical protein